MSLETCTNCKIFLYMEEKQLKLYDEVSQQNIKLLRKVQEQNDLVNILKKKISNQYFASLENKLNTVINNRTLLLNKVENSEKDSLFKNEVISKLHEQIVEADQVLKVYTIEKESFENIILKTEREFSEKLSYAQEMVEYYREALFDEMKRGNNLKCHFLDKLTSLKFKQVKEENQADENNAVLELNQKYKVLFKQKNEEIKRKEILIDKLKSDRKVLYAKLANVKKQYEALNNDHKDQIKELKSAIVLWQQKCENLEARRKLEADGYKTDIKNITEKLKSMERISSGSSNS